MITKALGGYHVVDRDHRFKVTVVGADPKNGLIDLVAERVRIDPPDTRVAFTLRIEAPVTLCAADEVDGYPHEVPCAAAGVLLLEAQNRTYLICASCANDHADRNPAGGE